MRFEGDGWISIDGGDNESSGGVFGEVFLLYFETWDEDGFGDSRISRLKPMHLPEYLQQASSSL